MPRIAEMFESSVAPLMLLVASGIVDIDDSGTAVDKICLRC
ncbi:MAG: hypothetical protein AAF355_16275 [Myxococcota bacterium]